MITGTAFILIMSLSVRRLPYTIRSSVASLQQISPSIEEAAESLGSSRLNTFSNITVPMMLPGIISGAILSWVTMISELSTSILLYNAKTKTMTVAIYTEVLRGNYGVAVCFVNYPHCLDSYFIITIYEISKNNSITL